MKPSIVAFSVLDNVYLLRAGSDTDAARAGSDFTADEHRLLTAMSLATST